MIENLRRSKEKIENYNQTLEQRVAERTAELLKVNEELRKNKMALSNMMKDMKEINMELSYQKEFVQSILNNMADGVDVISKDYIIEFENKVLLDIFGNGVGRKCYQFYFKREEPCPHCTALKAITNGKTYRGEYVAPNGRCYLVTSSPFKKPDGSVSAIKVIRDITESKRAEQQIRQLKEFNEYILTSLKEGIWVLDLEGNTIYANPALSELSGYSLKELKEKVKEMDLFTPEGQEIIKRENKKRLEGRSSSYETVLLTKDGKKVPVLISGSPYYIDGQVKGTLGVITDISEIKKLERKLSQRHEQLKKAYQKLKALDELKSQFIATVSHELRTPLTSILSFSEILLKYDGDKDTRREFLTIINKESQRLSELIDDILDLSKIESGRMEWHMDHISIKDVIKRAVDSMGVLCQRKGLQLRVDLPEGLPPVFADPEKILQVMQNLVSNAVKFTPEGGRIIIGAEVMKGRRADDRTNFVKVSVSDTGVGIAPEKLKVIFEKFRQIGDTLTDKPKGTGLGLAICKEIIRHHGGKIWAKSQVGKGSTFSFTLPISNYNHK